MAEKEKKYDVTVLSRDEVTTFPKIGQPVVNLLITYVAAGLAPYTITIPKDEWTPEKERELIRKSIEARLKVKPETFKV
ncbi:MAG: hypothetical protein JRE40_01490 [Deltaproteobacteria bacterium]|nr:hypothetical protein [Deltaproteobacteria bacterium]